MPNGDAWIIVSHVSFEGSDIPPPIGGDTSGIYVIEKDKRLDTLYDPDDRSLTVDVKIPNPKIRTGLLP